MPEQSVSDWLYPMDVLRPVIVRLYFLNFKTDYVKRGNSASIPYVEETPVEEKNSGVLTYNPSDLAFVSAIPSG